MSRTGPKELSVPSIAVELPAIQKDPSAALHHVRRQRGRESIQMSLSMTPMIDIVFNLLIYFLLTIGFGNKEALFESKLPRTHGLVSGDAVPISPIRVRLTKNGRGSDGCSIQVDGFRGSPRDFSELATMFRDIRNIRGYTADTPILLIPADQIHWDHVVRAYHAAMVADFRNINFGVQ